MPVVEIASNASAEPLELELTLDGAAVTGATILAGVERKNGDVLDFDDGTFKPVGSVVTRYVAAPQVSAVSFPGLYRVAGGFDLATITNATAPDVYVVTFFLGGAPLPDPIEIRVTYVDTIALIRRRASQPRKLSAGGVETYYAEDGVTPEATVTYRDVNGAAITIEPGNPAQAGAETPVP